jgi:pilus assembly protein Flp/PilA
MKNFVARFIKDESGATAIEYGLLAALISVVIIVMVKTVGTKMSEVFNKVQGNLS